MANKRKTRCKKRSYRGNQNSGKSTPTKVATLGENSAAVGEVSQPQADIILSSEPDVCIRSRKVKTASPVLQEELQEDYFLLINIDKKCSWKYLHALNVKK